MNDEHKVMTRQLVSIFTFFLINKAFAILFCLRVMMNFIKSIMYNSHTNENLKYFQTKLNNMNKLKNVFIKSRFVNRRTKRRHFNFSQFHVMIHYVKFIRYFESVIDVKNSYDENAHKFIIKNFYNWINRNFDFNEQILFHNIRRQNILIMNDVLLHVRSRLITITNEKKSFNLILCREIRSNCKFENCANWIQKIIAFWNSNTKFHIHINELKFEIYKKFSTSTIYHELWLRLFNSNVRVHYLRRKWAIREFNNLNHFCMRIKSKTFLWIYFINHVLTKRR